MPATIRVGDHLATIAGSRWSCLTDRELECVLSELLPEAGPSAADRDPEFTAPCAALRFRLGLGTGAVIRETAPGGGQRGERMGPPPEQREGGSAPPPMPEGDTAGWIAEDEPLRAAAPD